MEAPNRAVYRIGQLAAQADVSAKAIRFYEASGLMARPERTDAGYRLYGAADVERVRFIKRAQTLGLSLGAIREVIAIREGGEPPCTHVRLLLDEKLAEVQRRLAALRELEQELLEIQTVAALVEPRLDEDGYCCILDRVERDPHVREGAATARPWDD